jgi:hypothetical protein
LDDLRQAAHLDQPFQDPHHALTTQARVNFKRGHSLCSRINPWLCPLQSLPPGPASFPWRIRAIKVYVNGTQTAAHLTKRPKRSLLIKQQKQQNHTLAKERILCEHALGDLKRFAILRGP